ncbi:MAG TPA: hypothetical protein VKB58_04295 [Terriglobales bacterium]|nr:hypothetical protein [Terriglobales bacterium]
MRPKGLGGERAGKRRHYTCGQHPSSRPRPAPPGLYLVPGADANAINRTAESVTDSAVESAWDAGVESASAA